MGDYLKLFKTHSEYEAYSVGGEMLKPNVSYCRQENEVHYNPWTWADTYLIFVAKEAGTFTFTPQNSNVISYSTDNGDSWIVGNSVEVNSGDRVLWKGTMTPSSSGMGTFSSTANFDAEGNVMSLLFGDNFKGQVDLTGKTNAFYQLFYNNDKVMSAENLSLPATTLANRCYYSMFQGCTSLVAAPELPATTLERQCYYSMFQGCTSLVTAPEPPATTLADYCYGSMFKGCTALATAPVLPATTLASSCYSSMFQGCTSLVTAPSILPATTLTSQCYYSMFQGCTSLVTAPELSATSIYYGDEGSCVNMFQGCTSLVTAPSILHATTLNAGCYYGMFKGCTALTKAPVLPATTLASSCYGEMFRGCTNLNYIKAMFTTTPGTDTMNWVDGVASTGTFVKNSAATWNVTGVYGIPSGWTVETASA